MPNLYVCVYRRHVPPAGEWREMVERSRDNPALERFLDEYWRDDRYFDWGDDPSFFGALDVFADARRASWSVCRPNVREKIVPGDGVAFFILKPDFGINRRGTRVQVGPADYFYVGFGTVGDPVDRAALWTENRYRAYRSFFNALARPTTTGLDNVEVFPQHDDWVRRSEAPIVLFEPATSRFDLESPTRVARYDPSIGVPERWTDDAVSTSLQRVLSIGVRRWLRTSDGGHPHPHLRLERTQVEFDAMRSDLLRLVGAS